jgi:tetratricopeptide (TPR) repeat protein
MIKLISVVQRLRAGRRPRALTAAAVGGLAAVAVWLLFPYPGFGAVGQAPFPASLQKAYAELQAGLDAWDPVKLSQARDSFLAVLVERKEPAALLAMSVGLADLRLASYHLAQSAPAEAERFVSEGESYLDRAMKADPKSGEAAALYGFLLGLDLALHPDQAMTLGMESFAALSKGVSLEPANPRVHLLNGQYLMYVPEAYGGGAAAAIVSLEKAAGLFEKEVSGDPLHPAWGKDQAYTYLGLAYGKTDPAKAKSCFEKALAVNPASGQAKSELAKLGK